MKNTVKTFLIGLGMVGLMACQKVPQVTPSTPYVPEATPENQLEMCADGTLNCYITVENTTTTITIDELNFATSYFDCMDQCLATQGCSTNVNVPADLNTASNSCPTEFAVCDSQCSVSSANTYPDSDNLAIPAEPRMAVIVEIRGCYDVNPNEMHEILFQGPNVTFNSIREATRNVRDAGFLDFGTDHIRLGYDVGRNPGCSAALRGKVNVKFKPVVTPTIVLGESVFTVIPFADDDVIEKNYKAPHSISFGIPSEIREQIDMSEMAWMAKSYGASANPYVTIANGFSFYNNDIAYGVSQVVVFPHFTFLAGQQDTEQTITMVMFAKQAIP